MCSIQLFDWESSGGCTPDELYRHLRPRTDTLSSRSSLNFQDLSKTCRFVTSAEDDDFSALAQHVRFVHSSLSERLYDLPIFSSEQRKRNAVETLWKSLAYVLTSYDWASIAHSTDDVCAVVVLAPMRAVSGGDGGTSDIASFQKLRPHIDKHRLKLIWLDSDRREGDGNVSTPSSLLAVNFGVMPLSDVLSPVTPQHQFAVELTRLVSTSYSATAQLQPPSVSVPRFVGFDFLGPSVWPPTPQSRALGVPTKLYRWLTCGCRCPTGTTCMLSSLPTTQLQTNALRSASTPITVHGTVNASDIMPEWIGMKHVWTLIPNAGSVSLFQAPEGITPSHTPPVWLISFSRPSHATGPPVATGPPRSPVPLTGHSPAEGNTVYYLMLPMSPTEATIREVLCSPATLRGLLTLPDAESTEAISSTDGLARPVLALSMSRRVPPKSFSHELHSRATRLLMRSVVKTVQEPVSVTPPKLSREALLEYIDKCHKDIGVPTGRFSPSELLSSSSSEEEAGEEEEDVRMTGPDLIAGTHVVMLDSASRDGFPVDSGPGKGSHSQCYALELCLSTLYLQMMASLFHLWRCLNISRATCARSC